MKLTDEQIAELAPEWSTHYEVCEEVNGILFESADFLTWFFFGGVGFVERMEQLSFGVEESSKPIPRKPKPFDITQHEWSYQEITSVEVIDGLVFISLAGSGRFTISLDKPDSIAIAKALGVTGEDLK